VRNRERRIRRQALDVLYQADVTRRRPSEVVDELVDLGRPVPEEAVTLVAGVEGNLADIDERLSRSAEEWTVPRMAVVDRTILRLACYELLSGVPVAVAIDEAVRAAKDLSTEDSGRFVNGVLGRVARDLGVAPAREAGARMQGSAPGAALPGNGAEAD
jgi:N utilization substance protein B